MSSKIKYMKLTMLVLATLAMAPSVRAANSGTTIQAYRKAAIQLFNANRLDAAVSSFTSIVKIGPKDAEAQFYLGCALFKLGHEAEAYKHFGAAYCAMPNSEAGRRSKIALDRIYTSRVHALAADPKPASINEAEGDDDDSTNNHSRPTAVQMIARQAADSTDLKSKSFEAYCSAAAAQDDQTLAQFQSQFGSIPGYRIFIGRRGSGLYPMPPDELRNFSAQHALLQKACDEHLQQVQNTWNRQASSLKETANSLERQMNIPGKLSSLRLSPLGTNLYIRSYVPNAERAKPQAELVADQGKLVLSEHHVKKSALVADQDTLLLKEKKSSADLNVSGRLLRR